MSAEPSWVTKTNLTDWLRCPYAFWLADSGKIIRADMVSPFQVELMQAGIEFEDRIVADAQPIPMPPGGEAELFAEDRTLVAVRGFENPELRLKGRPDGLVTASGALEPVEIKSHRQVQHTDRIELGFYWLLLAPHRTRAVDPTGWVFLRQPDGTHHRVRVPLSAELITEAMGLVEQVRTARLGGVEPSLCRCNVCAVVRRDEVTESVWRTRHLSAIRGVGRTTVEALSTTGYRSWDDLIEGNPDLIVLALANCKPPRWTSAAEVRRWQAHARALIVGAPVLIDGAAPFPVPNEYVAFDLEYVPGTGPVWLTGARAVTRGGDATLSIWTDEDGETALFADLDEFLAGHPDAPLVTWNGITADIPALRGTATRTGQLDSFERIAARHIDLYDWVWRNRPLPISGFGAKDVSDYCGITGDSPIGSGREALNIWQAYRRNGNTELRDKLVIYNRDDVDSLVDVTEDLRAVIAGTARPTPGQRQTVSVRELVHEQPIVPTIRERHRPEMQAAPPWPADPLAAASTSRTKLLDEVRRRLGLDTRNG